MFKRAWWSAALAAVVVSTALAGGQPVVRYDSHRVVQVDVRSHQDIQRLEAMGARLYGEAVALGPVDYLVSPDVFEALRAAGMPHRVVVEDIQPMIDAERARLEAGEAIAGGNWYLDFKDLDAINTRLGDLIALNPAIASPFVVGQSLEGRDINGVRITGPGSDKPAVLINGCQHAREWISPMTVMYVIDQLINLYGIDPEVTALVDAVEFLVVPVVNPDGYVYSWGPDRLWRKNRRDNGNGTWGVDLNRNWSVGWGDDAGSSGNGDSETFRGPAPFSEPETTAMKLFYEANPQIVANIDFHAFSQLVLYPWGHTTADPPNADILESLGATMSSSIFSVHGEIYTNQQATDLYIASGISIDWTFGNQGVFSYTFELRPEGNPPGFILPPDQIIPTVEENFPAVLDLAEFSTQGAGFSFPAGLPSNVVADTSTTVYLLITSIASEVMPASASLWSRLGDSGPFSPTPLVDLGNGYYEATLPPTPCGEQIHYYFQVETADTSFHASPEDAPTTVYAAAAFQETVTFADDFESDLGWAVSGAVADGGWERGTPIPNAVCDRGNPDTDGDGSGQCFVTDNSEANQCNSDVDDGTTTLTSPVLDASDPAAVLSYWRWYDNTFGSDPNNDVFVVEISDDNGGSWVELETVGPGGPEAAGGWFLKEFLIADVAGVGNTSQFRVRFHASDLNAGSVIEAAVDGVEIKTLFCEPGDPCPWDLDGSGTVDTIDFLDVLAQWGTDPGGPPDFNGDGNVDTVDFLELLANWGGCP